MKYNKYMPKDTLSANCPKGEHEQEHVKNSRMQNFLAKFQTTLPANFLKIHQPLKCSLSDMQVTETSTLKNRHFEKATLCSFKK